MTVNWYLNPSKIALGLLLIFFIQGIFLIQSTSPTADEVSFNMVNGYTYLKTHDYRMTPANPALIREWMAWPWLFLNPRLDLEKASWKEADSLPFGKDFFYKDNRPMAEILFFISRFMILLLGLGIGLIIYFWSKQLYGPWAAVLALSFYAFCPNVLAHSSLATTDIGVTLFSTMAAFFLWRYLEYSKTVDRWAFVMAFALAAAAKFSALIFGPVFLMIIGIKEGSRQFLKSAFQVALVTFLVVWASYGFEWKPILADGVPRVEEKLGYLDTISKYIFPHQQTIGNNFKQWVIHAPIPIPSYLLGIAGIVRSHQAPYLHFAFGQWTTKTQWYYYLFCFAVKMTLPFLILMILRSAFFKKSSSFYGNENLVILSSAAVLFLVTVGDSTGVGIRYLLPIIPMLFVWVSGLTKWAAGLKMRRGVLLLAVAANTLTVIPSFPHYISYFNPMVGGVEGGYHFVRGSDVDWGQGLKELAQYLKDKHIDQVTIEYFGFADPEYYGIHAQPLSDPEKIEPLKKVYAISLFYLEHARWTERVKATAIVGGSIMVYDLRH